MAYVQLPRNIEFSSPRRSGAHHDEFDIRIDGRIVHTFKYSTAAITGNSSEEFVIAQAHDNAKAWLRSHRHLPVGQ